MVLFGGCTIVQLYFVPYYDFWVQGVGGGGVVRVEKRTAVQLYCTLYENRTFRRELKKIMGDTMSLPFGGGNAALPQAVCI
jgi:hypothetical protein